MSVIINIDGGCYKIFYHNFARTFSGIFFFDELGEQLEGLNRAHVQLSLRIHAANQLNQNANCFCSKTDPVFFFLHFFNIFSLAF